MEQNVTEWNWDWKQEQELEQVLELKQELGQGWESRLNQEGGWGQEWK